MTKKNESLMDVIDGLLHEVAVERLRQNEQWGEQNHPSTLMERDRRDAVNKAEYWKQVNAARATLETIAWDGILLEEVFEALAEADPLMRRIELIQVAAVALAEVESIDRLLASENNPYETFVPVSDDDDDAEGVLAGVGA